MGKLKIRKPKPKRRKRRLPQAGEDAYYRLPKRADCGYEKRFRYNMSLGTYGVPAELLHWCSANCKHKWGWWFKNDNSWYDHWDHEKNEAYENRSLPYRNHLLLYHALSEPLPSRKSDHLLPIWTHHINP